MPLTPQITFQHIEQSDFIEKDITEKTEQLGEQHPEIIACQVVVDAPHRGKNKGLIYNVRINLSLPGKDIAVTREPGINHAHEDMYVAIRDAFSAARRMLSDRAGKAQDRRTRGPSIKDLAE